MPEVVAIDGTAASGKSTSARLVAQQIGFMHLETGAMYRAVTLACLRQRISARPTRELELFLAALRIEMGSSHSGQSTVALNGNEVGEQLRMPEVNRQVSRYAALAMVRRKLMAVQRQIGSQHDVVCEGRDIGTVVFPQAQYKFFLVANSEARAKRRYLELKAQGFDPNLEEIKAELAQRDEEDSTREHSPLVMAEDAIEVDTTNLTVEEQVAFIVRVISEKSSQGEPASK